MTIYLLMNIPFGCPSHDTDVLGAYSTKALANKALKEFSKEDKDGISKYYADELHIRKIKMEGK